MWHQSERSDWGDFPPLIRNGSLEEMKSMDGYKEAKAGDPQAALNLVLSLLSEQTIAEIKKMANGCEPIIVGIRAEEAKGRNQIPNAMAKVLSNKLGWEHDTNLYQISYAGRTGSDSSYRLAFPAVFSGEVKAGRDYLILDDNATMGGTIAGLKGYIENHGGKVIGAAVMSARATGLDLVPTRKQLDDIKRKHGDAANDYFQETFGYGIARLTRSEAGTVRTAATIDELRNRINEARFSGSRQNHGRTSEATSNQIEGAQRNATQGIITEEKVNFLASGQVAKEQEANMHKAEVFKTLPEAEGIRKYPELQGAYDLKNAFVKQLGKQDLSPAIQADLLHKFTERAAESIAAGKLPKLNNEKGKNEEQER